MHRRVCLIIVRRVIPFHFDQQIHIDQPDAVPTVGPNPSEYCFLKIFMWSYFSDEPSLFRRAAACAFACGLSSEPSVRLLMPCTIGLPAKAPLSRASPRPARTAPPYRPVCTT